MKRASWDIAGSFDRLSQREKVLFGLLISIFLVILVVIYQLVVGGVFAGLKSDKAFLQEKIEEIQKLTPEYLKSKKEYESLIKRVQANTMGSVRIPLNEIAKTIEYQGNIRGATGNRLADIISFEGQNVTTPLFLRPRSKKAKKHAKPDLVRIEQTAGFREVPIKAFLEYLDKIDNSGKLMWVTKVKITRRFNNMSNARASITVATLQMPSEGK